MNHAGFWFPQLWSNSEAWVISSLEALNLRATYLEESKGFSLASV